MRTRHIAAAVSFILTILLGAAQALGAVGAYNTSEILATGDQATITFDDPGGGGWTAPFTETAGNRPVLTVTSQGFGPATGIAADGVAGYTDLTTGATYDLEGLKAGKFAIVWVSQVTTGSANQERNWSAETGAAVGPRAYMFSDYIGFTWTGTAPILLLGADEFTYDVPQVCAVVVNAATPWSGLYIDGVLDAEDTAFSGLDAASATSVRLGSALNAAGNYNAAHWGPFFICDLTAVGTVNSAFGTNLAAAAASAGTASEYDAEIMRRSILAVDSGVVGVYWTLQEAGATGGFDAQTVTRYLIATGAVDDAAGGTSSAAGCDGTLVNTAATSGVTLRTVSRTVDIIEIESEAGTGNNPHIVTVNLNHTIHDDDTATIDTTAAWITDADSDTTGATDDSAVTISSTLDYPQVIASWAADTIPFQRLTGTAETIEFAAFSKHALTAGMGGIERGIVQVSDGDGIVRYYGVDTPTAIQRVGIRGPADTYYVYQVSVNTSAFGDVTDATIDMYVAPEVGDVDSLRDSTVDARPFTLVMTLDNGGTYAPTATKVYLDPSAADDSGDGLTNTTGKKLLNSAMTVLAALNTNNGSTCSHGTIYVVAGDHSLWNPLNGTQAAGTAAYGWCTITADPTAESTPILGGMTDNTPGVAFDGAAGYLDLTTGATYDLEGLKAGKLAIIWTAKVTAGSADQERTWSAETADDTGPLVRMVTDVPNFRWDGTAPLDLSGADQFAYGSTQVYCVVINAVTPWAGLYINGTVDDTDSAFSGLSTGSATTIRLGAALDAVGDYNAVSEGPFFILDLSAVTTVDATFAASLATAVQNAATWQDYGTEVIRQAIRGVDSGIVGVYWGLREAGTTGAFDAATVSRYLVSTGVVDTASGGTSSAGGCDGTGIKTALSVTSARTKWEGLAFAAEGTQDDAAAVRVNGGDNTGYVWIDNCEIYGDDADGGYVQSRNRYLWLTSSYVHDIFSGASSAGVGYGWLMHVVDCQFDSIGNDAIVIYGHSDGATVVASGIVQNVRIGDLTASGAQHSDVVQFLNAVENVVIQNLWSEGDVPTTDSHAFYTGTTAAASGMNNVAIVDSMFLSTTGVGSGEIGGSSGDHLLFWNSAIISTENGSSYLSFAENEAGVATIDLTNVSVRNSLFDWIVIDQPDYPNVGTFETWFNNNHALHGYADNTTGFPDQSNRTYHPADTRHTYTTALYDSVGTNTITIAQASTEASISGGVDLSSVRVGDMLFVDWVDTGRTAPPLGSLVVFFITGVDDALDTLTISPAPTAVGGTIDGSIVRNLDETELNPTTFVPVTGSALSGAIRTNSSPTYLVMGDLVGNDWLADPGIGPLAEVTADTEVTLGAAVTRRHMTYRRLGRQ